MAFVEEQNIARFRGLLETETDPKRRATIELLLAQEQAKIDEPGTSPFAAPIARASGSHR